MIPYSAELISTLERQAMADGIEEYAVGAGIIRDNRLLILIRADDETYLPGYAQLPSGGVDEGELIIDALKREIKEETGLDMKEVNGYAGFFDYVSESHKKTRQFNFAVRTTDYAVRLNPAEHSAYAWIYPDEQFLAELKMTPEMHHSALAF